MMRLCGTSFRGLQIEREIEKEVVKVGFTS